MRPALSLAALSLMGACSILGPTALESCDPDNTPPACGGDETLQLCDPTVSLSLSVDCGQDICDEGVSACNTCAVCDGDGFQIQTFALNPSNVLLVNADGNATLDLVAGHNVPDARPALFAALGDGAGSFTAIPAPLPLVEAQIAAQIIGITPLLDLPGGAPGERGFAVSIKNPVQGSSELRLFRFNAGAFGFTAAQEIDLPGCEVGELTTGELDGNPGLELVVPCRIGSAPPEGEIRAFNGDAAGAGFSTVPFITHKLSFAEFAGFQPDRVSVRDINGDGLDDLAVPGGNSSGAAVLVTRPNITNPNVAFDIVPLPVVNNGFIPSAVFEDLNGDGIQDALVVFRAPGGSVQVFFGQDPTAVRFSTPTVIEVGSLPQSVAAVDLDKDGDRDLVVGYFQRTSDNSLFFNKSEATGALVFRAISRAFSLPDGVASVTVGDANGDGVEDFFFPAQDDNSNQLVRLISPR